MSSRQIKGVRMFHHTPATSRQIAARQILASSDAMARCPRCDAIGAMDIKSIHPGLCGNDIIVYQCINCGAERAGDTGGAPVLHVG